MFHVQDNQDESFEVHSTFQSFTALQITPAFSLFPQLKVYMNVPPEQLCAAVQKRGKANPKRTAASSGRGISSSIRYYCLLVDPFGHIIKCHIKASSAINLNTSLITELPVCAVCVELSFSM